MLVVWLIGRAGLKLGPTGRVAVCVVVVWTRFGRIIEGWEGFVSKGVTLGVGEAVYLDLVRDIGWIGTFCGSLTIAVYRVLICQ